MITTQTKGEQNGCRNGLKAICPVSNALRSPSPDQKRSPKNRFMSHFLITALVASMAISVVAADSTDRVPFALYTTAANSEAGTRPYTFTSAMSGKSYSGLYHDRPVVTVADIDSFGMTYVEIAAAPFPAFSFRFTKSGAAKLQASIKATPALEFVVFIDGHCYATVAIETMKPVLDGNRKLNIAVHGSSDDMTMHLIELVVEKLSPKLIKP
jgi:hypothetical protein